MKLIIAALAVVFSTASLAGGRFVDGNRLYKDLTSTNQAEWAFASGYVLGVFDSLSTDGCSPAGIRGSQVGNVAKQWLARNPQLRHGDADLLLVIAFGKAWPCPKDNK